MIPRHRIHSLLAMALMLCLVAAVPQPTWASCKNSGGSAGSHRVGSQVSSGSVTICASAVSVTPARTATVPAKPKVIAKPKTITPIVSRLVPPVHRKPAAQPIKLAPKPAKKIIAKPTTKAAPKPTIKTIPGSTSASASSAMFTPAGVTASVFPSSELSLGQVASFSSNPMIHFRAGSVLNLPTEVRFTPVSTTWILDGEIIAVGNSANYSFSELGSHQVSVEVVYSVAYRVRGSGIWISEPDSITVLDDLSLQVSTEADTGDYPEPPPGRALLVGSDCLSQPGSFGCR
ncbi:MAG: hypothetical protein F2544_04725 [Actinobacteria bacterium]|uniref:Unannotated protein n=1 Tax=freshwater metagenome TaxID=449393 RepID=A0A6J6DAZ4_9ZZZZ|nr:hypothetical protein [Actinomycetota bacterium]